jgi:hypothetical protein
MIGDFTKITVSDSDDNLHFVRVTSVRLEGQMLNIPVVEIWRTVLLWMFYPSILFSLLLGISAQYKWCLHGFFPLLETSQVDVEFPYAPGLLNGYLMVPIGSGTYGFIHLPLLEWCLIVSFPTLVRIYTTQEVFTQ